MFKIRLVFKMMISAVICGVMLFSCGDSDSKNSPSDIADKMYKAALNKDLKVFVDFFDVTAEEKAGLVELLQYAADADKNPVVKFEMQGERISDDGTKAEVSIKSVRKNGDEEIDRQCFVKTDSGWKAVFVIMGGCL